MNEQQLLLWISFKTHMNIFFELWENFLYAISCVIYSLTQKYILEVEETKIKS